MLIDLHANVPPLELSHGAGQGLNPQPRGTGGHVLIKTKRAIAVKLGVSGKDGATGTALRSQQGDLNFWPGGISFPRELCKRSVGLCHRPDTAEHSPMLEHGVPGLPVVPLDTLVSAGSGVALRAGAVIWAVRHGPRKALPGM